MFVFFKEVVVKSFFNIDLHTLIAIEFDIGFLCVIAFKRIEKQWFITTLIQVQERLSFILELELREEEHMFVVLLISFKSIIIIAISRC